MDRARPPQARRPMVPLAVAGTVVQAPAPQVPPVQPPPAGPPLAAVLVALAVMAAGVVVNSPLMDAFGIGHRWVWGFLGFWAEVGGLAALLGMLFRQPSLAWLGAGLFFAVALAVSSVVWAGHLPALALIGAVAAWHLRRQSRRDAFLQAQGWVRA